MSIAVEALLQRDPGVPEPPDEAVELLVSRRPDMVMEPEQEERKRAVALAKAVETMLANDLSAWGEARLRKILDRQGNTFRGGLHGDPLARVEPLTLTFEPEAKVVEARERVYSPIKTAWLATCSRTLVALGPVFRNLQAV